MAEHSGRNGAEPEYLKRATHDAARDLADVSGPVRDILDVVAESGEASVRSYAAEFDGWDGEIVLSREARDAAIAQVSQSDRELIAFAHDNIRRFAEKQRASLTDFETELRPGLIAGQKQIPVSAAGCYVPGGRYAHIASALMTITTARAAGVGHVTACSPPGRGAGIPPGIVYAMDLAGADVILNLGGVQAVAAMAQGLFGTPPADIIAGPGNQFVAEAKRILFGSVGIDMVAGPTDSLILADDGVDAERVAVDLVSQAEHGANSPVWLVTDSRDLAEAVMARVPDLIADLPEPNRGAAEAAWRDYAEVILCAGREEMAAVSDDYAPEHLSVFCRDLDWWLGRLRAYGSLFLGPETTVSFGDKASGPNHVLPTNRAARYTGGLSVGKFLKTVTWQRGTVEGYRPVAEATARISRMEGMEGHARAADLRLGG